MNDPTNGPWGNRDDLLARKQHEAAADTRLLSLIESARSSVGLDATREPLASSRAVKYAY